MIARKHALLLGLLLSSFALAPASAESLKQALEAAYLNNPTLAGQRANLRATDEQVPQALSGFRPTVRGTGEIGYRKLEDDGRNQVSRVATKDDDFDLFTRTMRGEVVQPVYQGGQVIAAVRAAENSVRSGRSNLTSTEQQVLLDAVTAYANVFRDQSELDLVIRNEQRLARQLEAARARFEVGEVTRTDVFQAEARLAQGTADRIGAEGRLEQSRAQYRNVVGEAPGLLDRPPLPDLTPTSLDATINAAQIGNPDIDAAQFAERAALDQVDQQFGRLLPTVSLVGAGERGYEEARPGAVFTSAEALVRVTVPLYTAGADYSRIRQAKQTVAQRRQQIEASYRQVVRDATQFWSALITARAQIESRRKQVEANEVALEGVQREAEVGARTVLDILDAERELLLSQVDLVRAQRDEVVGAYQVVSTIGELTAPKLELDVPLYNPQKHYDQVRDRWWGISSEGDISSDFDRPPASRR